MDVKQLLSNNRKWAESMSARDPDFFPRLARQQKPEFLWIGCSDSRVPANWLRALKALHHQNLPRFAGLSAEQQVNLLCELNVQRQVRNVCHTTIVQSAWRRGQSLAVHGWIYGLTDGLVKDLMVTVDSAAQLDETFLYDQ